MWVRRTKKRISISEIYHTDTFGTLPRSTISKQVTDLPQTEQVYSSLNLIKIWSLSQVQFQSGGSK
jgi:hypothetical protein